MVKLEKHDKTFEGLAPTMSKSPGTAIGLAIGGSSYRLMNSFFKTHDVSHNTPLKLGLFVLTIVLTYLAFWGFVTFLRYSVCERVPNREQRYKITFKGVAEQGNFVGCKLTMFFSVVNLVCSILYFLNNDGTEGVFAGLNCLVLLLVFTFSLGMLPLRESYEKQEIIFEKIEEI